jgi:hypothetical protein
VFDAFIASEVLEHIPDLKIVAKEVSRSAKKEYIVVVSAPNERNWEIARLFMLRFPLKLEGHVNSITPKGLDEIFCSKASRKENIPRLPFDFCLTQIAAYQMSNR